MPPVRKFLTAYLANSCNIAQNVVRMKLYKGKLMISALSIAAITTACKQKPQQQAAKPAEQPIAHKPAVSDSTRLIGLWLDEGIKTEKGEQIAYQIVGQGDKNYIQVITFTGKKLDVSDRPEISPSAMPVKKVGEKYISLQDTNQVFVIYKGGDLLIHDETGMVARCKRML